MALSKRAYPYESIKDPAIRDAMRILWDRIHELESRKTPASVEGAITQEFADERYQQITHPDQALQDRAVAKLVAGTPLTESEARSLL